MNPKTSLRRRHGVELKAQVLRECQNPGASVAAVAQAHGLNANLVHRWRRLAQRSAGTPSTQFIALPLTAAPAPQPQTDIRIELRRGALLANITWPTSAAQDCGAWLRELLR